MVAIPKLLKTSSGDKKTLSIDLHMYEIAEDKDVTIQGILRLLMEASFDCAFNYYRNHSKEFNGGRECEYQKCNYICV